MEKEKDKQQPSKSKWPLYISLLVVGALVASYFLIEEVQQFINNAWTVLTSDDDQRITAWVDGFGWFGPIVLVLAMIVQMFLLVIPSVLLIVVSILAYGPIWGSAIVFVAVFAASTVGYVMGSYIGKTFVLKILGQSTKNKIEDFIEHYGFWAVIVTRLNPFLSNDAISFVGGMLKMGYWRFIGATLLGIAPLTVLIAIMGKSNDTLKTGLLWVSLISLALFIIYYLYNRNKNKP